MAIQNSVVIINHNAKAALAAMLKTLKISEAVTSEFIVVDNASFDGSIELVEKEYPSVKVLKLEQNRGWAAAANRGMAEAMGSVVVFCHADILATAHDLAELADRVREGESKRTVAVLPTLVGIDREPQPFVGRLPGIGRATLGMFSPAAARKCGVPYLDHVADHEWASLACAAFNCDVLHKLGGFDEKFFMYYADADLFRRLHEKMYRIGIRRDVKVVHASDPNAALPPHLARLMRKDQQRYFEKHRPAWEQGVLRFDNKLYGMLKKDAG